MRVTFTFSDKSKITLEKDKAEQVMGSPENIVMISDESGRWTGLSINKSFIINTTPEYDDALEVGSRIADERQLTERQPDPTRVAEELNKIKKRWAKPPTN